MGPGLARKRRTAKRTRPEYREFNEYEGDEEFKGDEEYEEFKEERKTLGRPQTGMRCEAARTFQDLLVWQRSHALALAIYQLTTSFPRQELFGLTSQTRRAAVSIAANIAEGFKRKGRADKVRFLNIAQASLEECRYYLILTHDLRYADTDSAMSLLQEVSRFLEAYVHRIASSLNSSNS
jgi:four helix bundle protein